MTSLRMPALIALLALAVATPAAAAPKSKSPTTTVSPITAKPLVKPKAKAKVKPAQIDPKLKTKILGDAAAPPTVAKSLDAEIMRKAMAVPALSKKIKRDLLARGGIVIAESELEEPARLTVRAPVASANTHLSLGNVLAHFPAEGTEGVAQFEQAWAVPTGNPLGGLLGFGGGGDTGSVGVVGGQAIVRFRAAAGKHYIVDCSVAWEDDPSFGSLVTEGSAMALQAATTTEGHVIALVPARTDARSVSVTFFAGQRWSLNACEITPAG